MMNRSGGSWGYFNREYFLKRREMGFMKIKGGMDFASIYGTVNNVGYTSGTQVR